MLQNVGITPESVVRLMGYVAHLLYKTKSPEPFHDGAGGGASDCILCSVVHT